MKILLAPDKFKGSLSAENVCLSLSEGILEKYPFAEIVSKPMADGGDGSLDVLEYYFDLETITLEVNDPLFRPIRASYKLMERTAYIELAVASGIVLLETHERDCMKTSTSGTGQLILDAIQKGANTIYLFIGGSATNDGGMGIAHALGYTFFDVNGDELTPIGKNLNLVAEIRNDQLIYNPQKVAFKVVCDVTNPFYGAEGAAYVYGPQKGATPENVKELDVGLRNLATAFVANGYPDITNIPGAGAAGGVGGGAVALLGATLVSGIQTFIEITHLEGEIQGCDIVITGEGKLDNQTAQGKVISGVCDLANRNSKPIIAVCGDAEKPIPNSLRLEKVYTVLEKAQSLEDAMENTAYILKSIGEEMVLSDCRWLEK